MCILASREEEGTKKGISPFKNISWKLHIPLLLISCELELSHMATSSCKGDWEMNFYLKWTRVQLRNVEFCYKGRMDVGDD